MISTPPEYLKNALAEYIITAVLQVRSPLRVEVRDENIPCPPIIRELKNRWMQERRGKMSEDIFGIIVRYS